MKAAQSPVGTPEATPKSLNQQAMEASKSTREVDARNEVADLVKRVQAGDQAAFRALYDLYNRRAFAIAFGVVKNQHDALDIVQDAFVKVHKHIGSFQGTSSFYTWLYRIVMNLAIDHTRRARKVTEFDETISKSSTVADGAVLPQMAHDNPGKTVARHELSAHIQAALAELPEYHRAVILLREIEGLSYEEMASILRVPKGTIMSRLFHARRKMQERLEEYLAGDFKVTE
jgi:RNA polymerase sigma-70 factor (ECF subfamily)